MPPKTLKGKFTEYFIMEESESVVKLLDQRWGGPSFAGSSRPFRGDTSVEGLLCFVA